MPRRADILKAIFGLGLSRNITARIRALLFVFASRFAIFGGFYFQLFIYIFNSLFAEYVTTVSHFSVLLSRQGPLHSQMRPAFQYRFIYLHDGHFIILRRRLALEFHNTISALSFTKSPRHALPD